MSLAIWLSIFAFQLFGDLFLGEYGEFYTLPLAVIIAAQLFLTILIVYLLRDKILIRWLKSKELADFERK